MVEGTRKKQTKEQKRNLSRNRNESMIGIGDILSSSQASPCGTWWTERDHPTSSVGGMQPWRHLWVTWLSLGQCFLPLTNWVTRHDQQHFQRNCEEISLIYSHLAREKMPRNLQSDSILDSYVGKGRSRWRRFLKVVFNLFHHTHTHTEKSPVSPFLSLLTYPDAPLPYLHRYSLTCSSTGFPPLYI